MPDLKCKGSSVFIFNILFKFHNSNAGQTLKPNKLDKVLCLLRTPQRLLRFQKELNTHLFCCKRKNENAPIVKRN